MKRREQTLKLKGCLGALIFPCNAESSFP